MSKSVRKIAKAPGKCIFCEGKHLSKEHIWPQWTHKLISRTPHVTRTESRLVRKGDGPVRKVKSLIRQGDILTKQVRVVCKLCNSGWMKNIEDKTKPIATNLILGKPFLITKTAQEILSIWTMLKTFVIEHDDWEGAVSTQVERALFKNKQTIPGITNIFIASCNEKSWEAQLYWHTNRIGNSPVTRPPRANIQAITLGVGRIIFHVLRNTTNFGHFKFNPTSFGHGAIFQIYPPSAANILWPPQKILSGADVNRIATTLETYISTLPAWPDTSS